MIFHFILSNENMFFFSRNHGILVRGKSIAPRDESFSSLKVIQNDIFLILEVDVRLKESAYIA